MAQFCRTWCQKHYSRWLKYGEPNHPVRTSRPARGMTCDVDGCGRPVVSNGRCAMHESRMRRYGTTTLPQRIARGSLNPDGYVRVLRRGHPNAGSVRGDMLEHRFVMSEMLGRALLPSERVHHVNGIRHDNRPANLELWSTSQPMGQRVEDKVAWAREVLIRYGDTFTQPRLAHMAVETNAS